MKPSNRSKRTPQPPRPRPQLTAGTTNCPLCQQSVAVDRRGNIVEHERRFNPHSKGRCSGSGMAVSADTATDNPAAIDAPATADQEPPEVTQ